MFKNMAKTKIIVTAGVFPMLPLNPRELKKILKRYGIELEELTDVEKVEIYTRGKKIVLNEPQVLVYKMSGQMFFQISSSNVNEENIQTPSVDINEDDIRFVMEQTGASFEEAKKALIDAKGDILQAIMSLRNKG
ncbi:MAG: nascent polypeptide-associated complex protein [Desulfurococcaceae archaeon]